MEPKSVEGQREARVRDRRATERLSSRCSVEHWRAAALAEDGAARCQIARGQGDLRAIARLRRDTSAERDGGRRAVLEPIDAVSANVFARVHKRAVAAMRVTRAVDALADAQLAALVETAELTARELTLTVICSRLVACAGNSARSHMTRLFRSMYHACRQSNVRYSIVAACPLHVEWLDHLGYVPLARVFVDRAGRETQLMSLDLLDVEHLEGVRSPLLADRPRGVLP